MPCPSGTISYIIQSGDTLYRIASRFNTTVQAIIAANPGLNPNELYIGQEICVRLTQATAQIADRPIIVNGENINAGLYPVLNYKPPNAQYPYIYVPISEFGRVGARVMWDDERQLLSVVTDYYAMQEKINSLQKDLEYLKQFCEIHKSLEQTCQEPGTVVFSEITQQYFKIGGQTYQGDLTYMFDIGVPYISCVESDVGAGVSYLRVSAKDKNGVWHVLYTGSYSYQPVRVHYRL